MCGIFGQITPGKPVDLCDAYAAIESLTHRGPDGLGVALGWLKHRRAAFHLNPSLRRLREETSHAADFFLGHRRLAVIDLATDAFQPMANEDGTVWVVFNGEIYNHRDLRDTLEGLGHRFRTDHADTEVLVHGYEQWGDRVVDRLRGMFAMAVLDLRHGRVFLARDRFGEKPLYYAADASGVVFASELKALARLPGLDRTISPAALVDYLSHGLVPAPRTIYRAVNKLRAAERVTLDLTQPERIRSEIYWTPAYEPDTERSQSEWAERFEAELSEAIRLRMIGDVPLGTFLSGGLDSTIVTREMSRASRRAVRTFSIGFDDPRFDETPYAAEVARRYATVHRSEILSPDGLLDTVPRVAEIFDEPFADSSAIPTLRVSRLAREDVTVALCGDGGDELLAGYRRYRLQHRLARFLDPQPNFLVKAVFQPIAAAWPRNARGKALLSLMVPQAKLRYFKVFLDDDLVAMADPELARGWTSLLEAAWPNDATAGTTNLIDRMCATDCRFYIPEDLMVKVDRTSMSVSLETRCPLLDHKLFELVGRMPLGTRFDGKQAKRPFRKILERDLGRPFVDRPKKGFSVPLGQWFRAELNDELNDTLLKADGLVASLLTRDTIRRLIDDHCTGGRDQSSRLWKLYMLEKWNEHHGSGQPATTVAQHV